MVRNRKAWVPLLVALGLALGVFGLLLPESGSVVAQATPSATRTLSTTSVAPGGEVDVTVTASDFGQFGGIIETLPTDFTYKANSGSPSPREGTDSSGRITLTFTLFGGTSASYTAVAPSQGGGDHHFDGVLRDDQSVDHTVGGQNTVSVTATVVDTPEPTATPSTPVGGPSATRAISASQVAPGESFTVTVDVREYGSFGGVVETLPTGFAYGSSTHSATRVSGQEVTFTLFGESSVTYTVTASSRPGSYMFSGILRDDQSMDHDVGGDSDVYVAAPEGGPKATRSFPSEYVDPGSNVVVTIEASNYGQFGGITESIPTDFTYVTSSLPSSQVTTLSGNSVRFTLFGDSSFTYTVTASATEGAYNFTGVLRDDQGTDHPMNDSVLNVGTAPNPTATPVPPTATPDPDVTPTAPTRTPRPTAVPPAPPTPVAIEKVDVTEVEGATAVQPDESATVSSEDGMATVMLPTTSRARTYQVMVVTDAANCEGASGALKACAMVKAFDAEGNLESNVELIRRATVVMTLSSSMVDDLGGLPTVFQANALGAFSVQQMSAEGTWSDRRFSMGLTDDGGVSVTVTGLRSLGSLALTVDEDILQTAMYQVAGITPTAVPTPEPTAVPEPTPTAVPAEVEPEVGDATAPVGLLIVLALTGALMVYTGTRVVRGRRSAVR